VLSGEVYACEELAGGAGVFSGTERRPGDGVFVEVDSGGEVVDFVSPVAEFQSRVAGAGGEDGGHVDAAVPQVVDKAVFFREAGSVADGDGVSLDENAALRGFDQGGCGEGTRACGDDRVRLTCGWEELENGTEFGERKGRPIRLDERAVESVSQRGLL